jgi:malonate transporter
VNSPAVVALLPVIFLIGLGWTVARVNWVSKASLKDLSNLLFLVLLPALLFRTMARVRLEELDFAPIGIYFLSVGLLFSATMLRFGFNTVSAARGLAHIFSNTVLIGVPLVGLAFGDAGLITLFTLVSLHSLVILTTVTMIFELAIARDQRAAGVGNQRSLLITVLVAIRKSILHPVPLPILIGLLYGQLGLPLPEVMDTSLKMLGAGMGPLALILVGATLAYTPIGAMWRPALRISLCKVLIHPLLFFACAWALGQHGPGVDIMLLVAALPVGANVFLFTQRYQVAEDEVSTSIAISTAMALISVPAVLALLHAFG